MSDLTGEAAFATVLDRCETLAADLRAERDKASGSYSAQRQAEARVEDLVGQMKRSEVVEAAKLKRLAVLWQAADHAYDTLSDQGVPIAADAKKKLRDALDATTVDCDQVPF